MAFAAPVRFSRSWTTEEILHNADLVYHRVGQDRVGVNPDGHLQLDSCASSGRICGFEGLDFSKEKVYEVSIRTLRRLLNALESGEIDENKITRDQEQWVGRRCYGKIVSSKPHFVSWMPMDQVPDKELTPTQLICKKVKILAGMISEGRAAYKAQHPGHPYFYDDSDTGEPPIYSKARGA